MRILVISWYFPPANDVAALRLGKMAEYLRHAGHDVWVLTGAREHADQSLSITLPEERILRVPWFDVQRLLFHSGNRRKPARSISSIAHLARSAARSGPLRRFADAVNCAYMQVVQI